MAAVVIGGASGTYTSGPVITIPEAPLENDHVVVFMGSNSSVSAGAGAAGFADVGTGALNPGDASMGMGAAIHTVTAAEALAGQTSFDLTGYWSGAETGGWVSAHIRGGNPAGAVMAAASWMTADLLTTHVLAGVAGAALSDNGLVLTCSMTDAPNTTRTTPAGFTQLLQATGNNGGWLGVRDALTSAGVDVGPTDITISGTGDEGISITVVIAPGASGGSTYVSTPADSIGLTDAVSTALSADRTIADALGMTDSLVVTLGGQVDLADGIGLADQLEVARILTVTLSDTLELTDTPLDQTLTIEVTIDDALGMSDSLSRAFTGVVGLADALGLTDALDASLTGSGDVILGDQLGLSDAVVTVLSAERSLSDPLGMSDSIALERGTTLADALGLADALSIVRLMERSPADQLGLTDAISTEASSYRTLSSSLGLTDSITAVLLGSWRDVHITAGPSPARRISSKDGRTRKIVTIGEQQNRIGT